MVDRNYLQVKIRPAVKYHGGKSGLARRINSLMADHRTYLEPFAGGLNVLLNKYRSTREIACDLDEDLIHFYHCLVDHTDEVCSVVRRTPYSRESFLAARDSEGETDSLTRAVNFLVKYRMSRGGMGQDFSTTVDDPEVSSGWHKLPEDLVRTAGRLQGVEIRLQSVFDVLEEFDDPDTACYCLTEGSKVRTQDEREIPIETVQEGDVLHGGRTVLRKLERYYDGEILSFKIQGIIDRLRVTPEHPVLRIPRRKAARQEVRTEKSLWSSREIVPATELKEGDYLLCPLGGVEIESSFTPDNEDRLRGRRREDFKFTECLELYRLLGYYAAEGHVAAWRVDGEGVRLPISITLSLSNEERETYISDICVCCEKCFGVSPAVSRRDVLPGVTQVYIRSTTVACFIQSLIPGIARTKCLDPSLMVLPFDKQIQILEGWMNGDGGLDIGSGGRSKLHGTSASEILCRQMYRIANRCGMRPSIRKRSPSKSPCRILTPKGKEQIIKRGDAWQVYFSSEDAIRLGREVPAKRFRSTRKIINGHLLVRVRDIIKLNYSGKVFNLDTDMDSLFVTSDVLVHNCDPPYYPDSRISPKVYKHEFTAFQHLQLLRRLKRFRGQVILSGYPCLLYDEELAGWDRYEYIAAKQSSQQKVRPQHTEVLWVKPSDRSF